MAVIEYANNTVPDLVKRYTPSFISRDPLMKMLQSKGKITRTGGTKVRIRRVKGRHSDAVEINSTNIRVGLNMVETFSVMEADWSKMIRPIILPHIDRDRMTSRDEVKRWVDGVTKAMLTHQFIEEQRRIYTGAAQNPAFYMLGTLNGNDVAGTVDGLENGALQFQSPTDQATAAGEYLNEPRTEDTTYFTDNWHNQWVQHSGIGTDLLETVEEIKITADSYSEDEDGISIGILSIANHVLLGREVRTYPGGTSSAITYTVDDVKAGRSHPTVHIAGGVHYYSNRFINDTNMGETEPVILLNPGGIEWWINAGNDHKVTRFVDRLETSGEDADVAYMILEAQFAVTDLLAQGCTCR